MAGLIAALFGGHRNPEPDPREARGIGGYDMPRGPVGEGGFPGSTPAAPSTHAQSDDGRRERQLTPGQTQQQWKRLPTRTKSGLPRNPKARDKTQSDDTLVSYTPVIGANAPGAENVRNQVAQRYKAVPGELRTYLSAPNPGKNGGTSSGNEDNENVIGGDPTPVMVASRYVSPEGAQEGFATDRRIPYRQHDIPGHYRGDAHLRGAILDGQRYNMAAIEQTIGLPNGDYGIARKRGPLHRPVRFERPGPWTANYRDEAPDMGSQAPNMVHTSASKHGGTVKTKPPVRAHQVETRRKPAKKVRRG